MFNFFAKKYIKNYDQVQLPDVQEKYGILCSLISIVCNGIMVFFKLGFGFLAHSSAIIADGFNNLSDMGSNMATLFGFKLANKHPDADHPYGHGRIEYIVGMIISFLIFYVGFHSLGESIDKIMHPDVLSFSVPAAIALLVSMGLKLWMASFNKKTGKLIGSVSLDAAGQDSLNDVLVTLASLFSLVFSLFSPLPVDGWIGALVSLLVVKSGYEIFIDTMNPLLGQAPDKEFIEELVSFIKGYDVVLGIHDLMVHDYGPGRRYMVLHVEVDSGGNIMEIHDEIDLIERDLLKKYNVFTTIHMDPIDSSDEKTNRLKKMVVEVVKNMNGNYSIHDFRIVSGPTHTNLIFDVVIPSEDTSNHAQVRDEICAQIQKEHPDYNCVIEVEHSYV